MNNSQPKEPMGEITYLDDEAQATKRNTALAKREQVALPFEAAGTSVIIESNERRMRSYYLAIEMQAAWDYTYEKYIFPAFYGKTTVKEAKNRLEKLIEILDGSMIKLQGYGDEAVITQLENLLELFVEFEKSKINNFEKDDNYVVKMSYLESRRARKPFRKTARGVTRAFSNMAERAASPSFARRWITKIWGSTNITITAQDRERLLNIARASLRGVSNELGQNLCIRPDVLEAFQVLGLNFWATEDEVRERYRSLAQQYHPDKNPVGGEQFVKIKSAKELIEGVHFAPLKKEKNQVGKSDQ